MKVWILTEEYNQYDQYGEYFLEAFKEKPTKDQLMPFVRRFTDSDIYDWILAGGGRQNIEDQWFILKEVECT